MNGRHHHITMIVACQYCMDLPPDLRTNADIVYALKQSSDTCRKSMYYNFFGAFNSPKDFRIALDACTDSYQCLVLDNTIPTTDIPKIMFWYKAKFGRRFRLGCNELWNYHRKWFVSDTERYLLNEKREKESRESKNHHHTKDSRKRLESSNLLVRRRR